MQLVWESYKLDPYVQRLAEAVFNFQEKVFCLFYFLFYFCFFFVESRAPQQVTPMTVGPVAQTTHTGNSVAYSYSNSGVGSLTSLL